MHRDVKPSNVLLALDGPRLIDFGIARALDATASLTRSGVVVGSPGFMSPEQVTGRPVGPASDVFSLGALLVYAALGRGPFAGDSAAVLLYKVAHEEPGLDGLDGPLRRVAEACLGKDPARRPEPGQVAGLLVPDGGPAPLFRAGWLPAPLVASLSRRATGLLDLDVEDTSGAPGEAGPEPDAGLPGGFGPPPAPHPPSVPAPPPASPHPPSPPAAHPGGPAPGSPGPSGTGPHAAYASSGPHDAVPSYAAAGAAYRAGNPAGPPPDGRPAARTRRGGGGRAAAVVAAALVLVAGAVAATVFLMLPGGDGDGGGNRGTAGSASGGGAERGKGGRTGAPADDASKDAGDGPADRAAVPDAVPDAFIGRWTGPTTTQRGVPDTFTITIRQGPVGGVVAENEARLAVLNVNCGGEWKLRSVRGDRIVLDSTGSQNPHPGICSDGSDDETFTLTSDGTLRYVSGDPLAGRPKGDLKKTG